ncbi:DUF565 domain-containing protein [Synechococcus sp. CS-205]|uniref:DUF565 domain-containing protein n=1 Tax=Synechococcus sp. CS-205 TaxID=2847984 RepID=UPI00223B6B01|nr:DUF565 domain-containing protein [Synechococcus sp. CS-205]MCT0249247.1 DUF565 domain-containing protein [Synechococcus sp. CS-205]
MAEPGDGDLQPTHLPVLPASSPSVIRPQQTRLHRQVALLGEQLRSWADNPWRRLSLVLITGLGSFFFGGAVGMLTGALAYLDPLAALVCVVPIEISIRCRRWLMQRPQDRLTLQLVDAGRIGLLYGLLQEGFKLL